MNVTTRRTVYHRFALIDAKVFPQNKTHPHSPWHPSRLHPVCERDVIAPDVELPLPEADDAAEDVPGVDADAHVHVRLGGLADTPDVGEGKARMGTNSATYA